MGQLFVKATEGEPGATSRRIATIWLGVVVLVGGNLADWANWINWGPGQTDGNRRWILACAALFWLSLATLLVLAYDVVATWLEPDHVLPPSAKLVGPWPIPEIAGWIRHKAAKHHALIGLGGLVAGALIGHLVWKP
jgi:hypothetical protein